MDIFGLDELDPRYPANDALFRRRDPQDEIVCRRIGRSIDRLLEELRAADIDHLKVREYWADALLGRLLPANPYRDPVDTVAVRQDVAFLYFLQDRIERISEQLCKAMDRHQRSASQDTEEV